MREREDVIAVDPMIESPHERQSSARYLFVEPTHRRFALIAEPIGMHDHELAMMLLELRKKDIVHLAAFGHLAQLRMQRRLESRRAVHDWPVMIGDAEKIEGLDGPSRRRQLQ